MRGSILAQVPMEGGEDRFVPPPTSSEATSTMMFAAGDNRHDGRILTGAIRVHGRSAHRQLRVAMPEWSRRWSFSSNIFRQGQENLLPYDPH